MTNVNDITIKDIKEQYIAVALAKMPYRFKVFTDIGAYVKSMLVKNKQKSTINACLQTTDSDVLLLGGGLKAVAINCSLRFLIPVPDESINNNGEFDGDYGFVNEFRERLAGVFATSDKLELKSANGKTYVGGVSSGFPIGGELAQRQGIGYSYEYTCYLEFAYLANALNASDVKFFLDNDPVAIPYTQYTISREATLTANIFSTSTIGESQTYAENTVLGINLSLPAIDPSSSPSAKTIYNYLLGLDNENANTPHKLIIKYGTNENLTLTVIFGKVADAGEGISNVSRQISFVPYVEAEDNDGDEEE